MIPVTVLWEGKVIYTILHRMSLRRLIYKRWGHCYLFAISCLQKSDDRKTNTTKLIVVLFIMSSESQPDNELLVRRKVKHFAIMSTAECGPSQGLMWKFIDAKDQPDAYEDSVSSSDSLRCTPNEKPDLPSESASVLSAEPTCNALQNSYQAWWSAP